MSRQKCQKDYSLEDEFSQGKIWSFLFPAKVGCQSGFGEASCKDRIFQGRLGNRCQLVSQWWLGSTERHPPKESLTHTKHHSDRVRNLQVLNHTALRYVE